MVVAAEYSQTEIKSKAAAGYFRAIALWLNQPVAEQGIYVKVRGGQAGCLELMVEFERPPQLERLLRFICHRIWLLNSPIIEGVYIAGRSLGETKVLWKRKVRILSPALRAQQSKARPSIKGSIPPRLRVTSSRPDFNRQMKTLRAYLLSGSAVAAFVLGCIIEGILSSGGPVLPSFSAHGQSLDAKPQQRSAEPEISLETPETTQVQYTSERPRADQQEPRSNVVDAALEPVAVIPYSGSNNATDSDVTMLFGGDFPLEGMSEEVLSEEELPLVGIEDYQNVDIALMNLGTSLSQAATTLDEGYHHRTRPEAAELLKQGGVDIVALSDTNIMEYGEAGLTDTLYTLDRAGVYRVGAGRNEYEARRPEILDVKGERIAYLSYSQGGDYAAHKDRPGVNAQDQREIAEDIRSLRDEVDWIVVNYRWQTDLAEQPFNWQTNLARLAIDQGADLVVGYHPQQLQGAEIYKGRPIAYALSDFIFRIEPDESEPYAREELQTDQDTAVLKVSLRQEQMKVEFLPVQVRDARPAVVGGSAGKAIMDKIAQASGEFEQPLSSSLVLDRKVAPQPQLPVNPNSPFVGPSAAPPSNDDPTLPVQPSGDSQEDWLLELEMPTEADLEDWGPKGDDQNQFKPIPNAAPDLPSDQVPPSTQQIDYQSNLPAAEVEPLAHPSETKPVKEKVETDESIDVIAEDKEKHNRQQSTLPTLDGPALTPETVPNAEGIEPYDEPLVGPLSVVDEGPEQQQYSQSTEETIASNAWEYRDIEKD